MRSWDLFDTLVASRSGRPAGDATESLYAVASNLRQVRPTDVIVSDYYAPEEALRVVRQVLGLQNRTFVTYCGKADGSVWSTLKELGVTAHTGDNYHSDFRQPTRHGVAATLFRDTRSRVEEILRSISPVVAELVREARLTFSFSRNRNLQELQFLVNFPFLILATVWLERLLQHAGAKTALLSSRDACLWTDLATELFVRRGKGLEAKYFLSGRLPRVAPSASYLNYANGLLRQSSSVIVDLVGSGWSLSCFASRLRHSAPTVLVTRIPLPVQQHSRQQGISATEGEIGCFVEASNIGGFEEANYARHPMVLDVDEDGNPSYVNPAGFPWSTYKPLEDAHRAWIHALEVSRLHPIDEVFGLTDEALAAGANRILRLYANWRHEFHLQRRLFRMEHEFIFAELERRRMHRPFALTEGRA